MLTWLIALVVSQTIGCATAPSVRRCPAPYVWTRADEEQFSSDPAAGLRVRAAAEASREQSRRECLAGQADDRIEACWNSARQASIMGYAQLAAIDVARCQEMEARR